MARGRKPENLALVLHILEPIGADQMNDLGRKLYVKFKGLTGDEQGQDLVEYALLVCLIALAAIAGVNHVATAVTKVFSNISTSLV
jgi:pilus assembly protein Flp/PilA